uniref:Uncharacterized protein n=1 Tax=Anguilla anguilla TaxID=7936 RepID=A0A0E9XHQ1_ANGAN
MPCNIVHFVFIFIEREPQQQIRNLFSSKFLCCLCNTFDSISTETKSVFPNLKIID